MMFLKSNSGFLNWVDIRGTVFSVLLFCCTWSTHHFRSRAEGFSTVTLAEMMGLWSCLCRCSSCCNSFARRGSCCVNCIAKFLMNVIQLISRNTCCVSAFSWVHARAVHVLFPSPLCHSKVLFQTQSGAVIAAGAQPVLKSARWLKECLKKV